MFNRDRQRNEEIQLFGEYQALRYPRDRLRQQPHPSEQKREQAGVGFAQINVGPTDGRVHRGEGTRKIPLLMITPTTTAMPVVKPSLPGSSLGGTGRGCHGGAATLLTPVLKSTMGINESGHARSFQ